MGNNPLENRPEKMCVVLPASTNHKAPTEVWSPQCSKSRDTELLLEYVFPGVRQMEVDNGKSKMQ